MKNNWKEEILSKDLNGWNNWLIKLVQLELAEQKKELMEEILSKLPPKFKRQNLGNKWNLETGEMQTYWCQSEEAVEYYNDCRQEVIGIIESLKQHE